jgi:type VI secretion system protein
MAYPPDEDRAYGVSFFERLETDAKPRSVTLGPDSDDVLRSIKLNITRLLNTRLGESLSAPELGLTDFNDTALGSRDLAMQIQKAVKECIKRFEPRIADMDIRIEADDSTLFNRKFHIIATIDLGALHQQVEIDLLLDSNRQYKVR